jgi:2-oxoglutarate dehydrogenase E2 component (dihydrolipoamide succinyltransferase)
LRWREEVFTLVDVLLPSLGESVTEGIVIKWMKKVGDHVQRDEPICEISTDKVDSEMPSPAAGVLLEIVAHEGDTVEVGARLAVIGDADGATPVDAVSPSTSATLEASDSDVPASLSSSSAPTRLEPANASSATGVVVSPVVRRILNDGGVDPRTVSGSGPGGSITRRDAEAAVANGPTDDVAVPLSNGRRRMAEHMVLSAQSTPHGFVAVEVDAEVFTQLDAVGRKSRDGDPIPDEAVVALAAVRALGEFAMLNSTFAGSEVVEHRTINLGFARHGDLDGMLVPVVHAAAGLTLRAFARRLKDLDTRLATRQLTTDDLMGGTFTLMGSPSAHTLFTQPIIIQPQVAVLSVGAVRSVPVVVTNNGAEALGIGRRLILGLTFDHRVCEPATAAAYLERVGELLASIDVNAER